MFVTKYAQPATHANGFVLFPGTFAIEVVGRSQEPRVAQLLATTQMHPKLVLL
ncbi:MAG: hypothetical protein WBW04_20305 [Nitrolancea sp.]